MFPSFPPSPLLSSRARSAIAYERCTPSVKQEVDDESVWDGQRANKASQGDFHTYQSTLFIDSGQLVFPFIIAIIFLLFSFFSKEKIKGENQSRIVRGREGQRKAEGRKQGGRGSFSMARRIALPFFLSFFLSLVLSKFISLSLSLSLCKCVSQRTRKPKLRHVVFNECHYHCNGEMAKIRRRRRRRRKTRASN